VNFEELKEFNIIDPWEHAPSKRRQHVGVKSGTGPGFA